MTEANNRSLVTVYSSPSVAETQLLRSMLAAEGVYAIATEANEPFVGIPVATSEVLVWQEDEERARHLIQQAELRHQARIASEVTGCCDAARTWQ